MQITDQMLSVTPNRTPIHAASLSACVKACSECASACVACADACLGERDLDELRRCIRLNTDCADIAGATARVLARLADADFEILAAQLESCACAAAATAAECDFHARHHDHCGICAEACRLCETECHRILAQLASIGTA
jgi:hypothetical protein